MMCAIKLLVIALASAGVQANGVDQESPTCNLDGAGNCAVASSALLQTVFQRDKGSFVQEPKSEENLYGTKCTGVQAEGRCWFLSDTGQNCEDACESHGRVFSYVIPNEAVTPRLVGHEPKQKQEPWVALECFSPSEDRYHPVNENAARHSVDDAGLWSHENCKLACPCGGSEDERCSWNAPPECAPKFMWKGVEYSGCATVDMHHDRPWCQHNYQHTEKEDTQDWSYCTHECTKKVPAGPEPEPVEPAPPKREVIVVPENAVPKREVIVVPKPDVEGQWLLADGCVKEFDYKGVHYVGCTGTDETSKWCSTTDPYIGAWKNCTYAKTQEIEVPALDGECTWVPAASCIKEFDYEGTHYVGCTVVDHDTPWCSNTEMYKGSWNHCTYTCPYPTPSESAAAPAKQVCTWQPNPACADAFEYKGIEHTSCITQDHPTPWCSLDRIHRGAWETCTQVCSAADTPVAPVPEPPLPPVPPVPVPQPVSPPEPPAPPVPKPVRPVPKEPEAPSPCDRQTDMDKDVVGSTASLDEVGFKIVAATSTDANMKAFACRIVSGLDCKVVDGDDLMEFVPHYSGNVTQESYKHLETELTSLCHGGAKWVVPKLSA